MVNSNKLILRLDEEEVREATYHKAYNGSSSSEAATEGGEGGEADTPDAKIEGRLVSNVARALSPDRSAIQFRLFFTPSPNVNRMHELAELADGCHSADYR